MMQVFKVQLLLWVCLLIVQKCPAHMGNSHIKADTGSLIVLCNMPCYLGIGHADFFQRYEAGFPSPGGIEGKMVGVSFR